VLVATQFGHIQHGRSEYELAIDKYEEALTTIKAHGPDGIAYAIAVWDGYVRSAGALGDLSLEAQVITRALSVYPEDDEQHAHLKERLETIEHELDQ